MSLCDECKSDIGDGHRQTCSQQIRCIVCGASLHGEVTTIGYRIQNGPPEDPYQIITCVACGTELQLDLYEPE